MLVLSRKLGQSFHVGSDVRVTIVKIDRNSVRIGIHAPDGGEGTVDALVAATSGSYGQAEVTGPLGERVLARFGLLGDGRTAAIEMAAASGLVLVPLERRNPWMASTRGTGELLLAAIAA